MTPSIRFAGTSERLRAVLTYPAIYQIGAELDQRSLIGRPRLHPPYVLLIFASLARITRSTVRTETDLAVPGAWDQIREQMLATIAEHRLDVPAPPTTPPAWHHWRRLRDEHLCDDAALAQIRRLHLPLALDLAHDLGLLRTDGPGSLTHPDRTRAVYGDGTIVRPIYAPPRAVRLDQPTGTTLWYPDRTGRLRERPSQRYDPDIAEHHGHSGPVHGHGYVAFHARGPHVYQRVVLTIDHIDRPGQEANTAVRLVGELRAAAGDGIQVVVYDGALRGTHIDKIQTRDGYVVLAKQPEYTDAAQAPAAVRTDQGRRAPSLPLGLATHTTAAGPCSHTLAAVKGRVSLLDLDDAGDPVVVATLTRGAVKRSRRKDGTHHFNVGYRIPCPAGDFTTWLSPHPTGPGDPRPEQLRILADDDPDAMVIRGIRSDAESNHAQFKRTLITERAMSLGWRRGLIDYYAFAWYSNALTHHRANELAAVEQRRHGRAGG
ncbi:hypothetical protein Q6348_08375 [Isoptericola sp. b441]|uniref:Transposase n=1 Tax=Actinotalea lenta TaxID=3064654 RepID=A0ABT9D8I4_9CELL|nr:hypothetical protein [Isoptericola sp. b441]MDO8107209.1 hypothetical protein [Isoptericola sp. b441]